MDICSYNQTPSDALHLSDVDIKIFKFRTSETESHQERRGEEHERWRQDEGADGDQPDTGQVDSKSNIPKLISYCRVYTIMRENKDAFGDTSFEDVKAQMDLYKA